jgi:hypothetical protein
VGTSDCHRLWQLGTTYTMVDAEEKSVAGVFAAIRAGRVRVITAPLRPFRRVRDVWDRDVRPVLGRSARSVNIGR